MEKTSKSLRYSGKLLPVEPEHVITISGKTKSDAEYFDIFLAADNGTDEDFGDIQFHITVMFTGERRAVVRNSYTKHVGWEGGQEIEENLVPGNELNPIKRGGDFKFSFLAGEEMFFVSIDEKPFCTYKYRKPLNGIRRINVYGDVEQVYGVNHYDSSAEKTFSSSSFIGSLPLIVPGTAMVVNATPHVEGKFVVDLSDNTSGKMVLQVTTDVSTGEISAKIADENGR
jgi:hypothetical protein